MSGRSKEEEQQRLKQESTNLLEGSDEEDDDDEEAGKVPDTADKPKGPETLRVSPGRTEAKVPTGDRTLKEAWLTGSPPRGDPGRKSPSKAGEGQSNRTDSDTAPLGLSRPTADTPGAGWAPLEEIQEERQLAQDGADDGSIGSSDQEGSPGGRDDPRRPVSLLLDSGESEGPEDDQPLIEMEILGKAGHSPDAETKEDETANGSLPVNIADRPSSSSSPGDDDMTPKTPAERVRFILADNGQEEGESAAEDLDLAVHALFCQMDVLCHFEDGESGWKEAARWLKYEEKVEAGDRWSKPHVATTSLHALFEVRKGIAEQTVELDLDAPHGCLHQVAENLTSAIMRDRNFSEDKRQQILDILLKPHKHKHRKGEKPKKEISFLESLATPTASSTPTKDRDAGEGDQTPDDSDINDTNTSKTSWFKKPQMRRLPSTTQEVSALYHTYPGGILPENLLPYKPNKRLMRKIPGGSEAANILIGQVDFLDEPVMAFARLSKCAILADLTEVAIPTRFIFLVLGPPEATSVWEYEEVGRGIAALFTDRVFCEVAYKSTTREDLVHGVDEFVDDLTVLPPSIWDPTTRLEPPEKTMSMDKIRRRLMDSARHAAGPEAFHFAESAIEDESLKRTGKLFGGLIQDMKRRIPWYLSDWIDGLHIQCLASIIFLYFACITPIVTFGGLLGHATEGYMGTMETLLAGCICGIIYALFSGQPLVIVGATGPLLIFESILYHFCAEHQLSYLPFRFFVGMWVTVILVVCVAFDLSALVRYVTRFTEESFAILISLIFIFEAFAKLIKIWDTHPIHIHAVDEDDLYKCHCQHPPPTASNISDGNGTFVPGNYTAGNWTYRPTNMTDDYKTKDHPIFETLDWSQLVTEDCITYEERILVASGCITESECLEHSWILVGPACNVYTVTHSVPDVFFLCCFLFIGTFCIAYVFRMLRPSTYFPSIVRSTMSDFAVLIAIVICTLVDYFLALDTPKLLVPAVVETTRPDRNWLVNPGNITYWWLSLAAILPALLATILIFLDQQITAVIVNRKEHKLKKGHGYHLDLLVLSVLIFICSVLGLPWFVAATVRAVTHVRSLIKESELRAPGERPQFLGVREQRLTVLCIHILIGLSVLVTSVLQHIPMAVLYGVFFYMGVTSLSGSQFIQRILIMFMPGKYQPDYMFLRHVPIRNVHLFTLIQIVCMGLMWTFKSIKKIALLFPIMILMLCFIRKLLDFAFSQSDLYWLDHLLPDEQRRKKEDGIDHDDDGKGLMADDSKIKMDEESSAGYFPLEQNPLQELPSQGEWDQLIYRRDYAAGRRYRPRRQSQGVIQRYRMQRGQDDVIADAAAEDQRVDQAYGPFRDRKFSI